MTEVPRAFRSTMVALTRIGNVSADASKDLRHAVASADGSGRFVFPAVPAGDYELRALSYAKFGEDRSPFRTTNARGLPGPIRRRQRVGGLLNFCYRAPA